MPSIASLEVDFGKEVESSWMVYIPLHCILRYTQKLNF